MSKKPFEHYQKRLSEVEKLITKTLDSQINPEMKKKILGELQKHKAKILEEKPYNDEAEIFHPSQTRKESNS